MFPELALTTFFPRWYEEDLVGRDPLKTKIGTANNVSAWTLSQVTGLD